LEVGIVVVWIIKGRFKVRVMEEKASSGWRMKETCSRFWEENFIIGLWGGGGEAISMLSVYTVHYIYILVTTKHGIGIKSWGPFRL
jgi:hypothetical protein